MPENVLFISDIHGNFYALQAILEEAKNQINKIDYIISLGDLIGYGPFPNEVISATTQFNICLLGNHDVVPIRRGTTEMFNPIAKEAIEWSGQVLTQKNRQYLQFLMKTYGHEKKFVLRDNEVYICHASPFDPVYDYILPTDSEEKKRGALELVQEPLIFIGHTHIPMDYKCDLGRIINPGSVGQPRDGDSRASALIWQVKAKDDYEFIWLRAKYDITAVARAIRAFGLPHMLSERLFFGK
ncbi:MAG: metallophosphoesterase family protein [Candidatus Hermodarchaeota archaeon]